MKRHTSKRKAQPTRPTIPTWRPETDEQKKDIVNKTLKENVQEACNATRCSPKYDLAVSGGWSEWLSWGTCSTTCDTGLHSRQRTCSNPRPSRGGEHCFGDSSEYRSCMLTACPAVDGGWSEWLSWGTCSTTCDTGLESRQRTCSNPRPSNGGGHCFNEPSEYRSCKLKTCPGVNGGWSVWSAWGTCSTTCEAGLQTRSRTCSNPQPSNGGELCFGESADYRSCNLRTCPGVNGGWSVWSVWGTCSTTCEAGLQTRNRTCSNPQPSSGGDHCFGDFADYRSCNLRICPAVNGGWSAWASWGTCSATCGTGLQSRYRICSNPRPSNGGEHCFGESTDYKSCHINYCFVSDGNWSYWSSWSSCSSTCTKTRSRNCTTNTGGRQCVGNSEDKENCNLAACAFTRLQVRIIGSSNRGRLEVSLNGSDWGTVCDDNFDTNDARVACRMLGYTGYAVVDSSSVVDGSGPIYLDDLACDGTESSLLYCRHSGWGIENCGHHEDVGVYCY